MTVITTKSGYFAQISEQDADLCSLVWFCVKPKGRPYIGRNKKKPERGTIYLHRLIAERMGHDLSDKSLNVDHMNGDTLDNRRENLRVVSVTENARNRIGWKTSKSGLMGVGWDQSRQKWTAYIGANDKTKPLRLGRFDTKEEALAARLAAEKKLWGVHPQRQALFESAA